MNKETVNTCVYIEKMQNEGHLHAYWDSRCKLVRVQTGFFKLASSGSGFVIDRSSLVAWMWSWLFQCNTSFCVLICVLSLWNIQYLYLPTEKKQQTGYGSGRFSQGLLRLLIPHLQLTSALLKCYVCEIVSKLWKGLCVYYVRMMTYVCTLSTCFCLRTENRSRKTHGLGWGGVGGHVNVPFTSYMISADPGRQQGGARQGREVVNTKTIHNNNNHNNNSSNNNNHHHNNPPTPADARGSAPGNPPTPADARGSA